jgi:cation diffusion facilitator CzcD-associated flavoprotein CzcO
MATKHMKKVITDEKILATLLLEFEAGCLRLTPGDHCLRDNVEVVSTGIARVTQKGIIDNTGTTHDVDVIICATGFDGSHQPRSPIRGLDRYLLVECWGEGRPTESYMSTVVARFPNMFGMCSDDARISPRQPYDI